MDALARIRTDPVVQVWLTLVAVIVFVAVVFTVSLLPVKGNSLKSPALSAYLLFFWNCFIKPHTGDKSQSQQDALESFYKAQANVYDKTRSILLRGREEMLGLVAAQLKYKSQQGQGSRKPIWVDIGGGTGYNVEKMSAYLPVQDFFHAVYIVDLSPSLLEVARRRFERLGWKNIRVVCQDARSFRLHEHEKSLKYRRQMVQRGQTVQDLDEDADIGGAELITLSYSLSMIPEFHSVIDSLSSLLARNGVVGVCDFYVQSSVEYQSRNYTGGMINRHCMWISRVFWRTWFELDRVNLNAARRDYLEYRFGTVVSTNCRNHIMGVRIPYYIWVGCSRENNSSVEKLAELDCAATESPFLSALDLHTQKSRAANAVEVRSKSYESALVNLAASLPLPASFYQNHHWRIHFDEQLPKHNIFDGSYLYAFTWEDSRVDARLLKVQADDVILALTSAGDNILSFVLEKPRRIHAVDLNPAQNHLLELKVAAFSALGYSDIWKLFGEGRHSSFQDILISKLSPHMSSLAFQYWLSNGPEAFGTKGLYYTGGSGHALRLVGWLFRFLRLSQEVKKLSEAQTLNEQREIWRRSIKKVLLNRILSWTVVSNEKWLWKALGVPPNQRNMIEEDYKKQDDVHPDVGSNQQSGHAIWEYVVNTLEPVVNNTLLSDDNHYYLLCLLGKYNRKSHPEYLTPKAHIKLSKSDAFDGLRIHTDEIAEVIARMASNTLTIAVVMDSMDWFDPKGGEAAAQIMSLNRALKIKGRVLLRSAGLTPWYIKTFEELGFSANRVAARLPGICTDRVNMYASTWICTKTRNLEEHVRRPPGFHSMSTLSI